MKPGFGKIQSTFMGGWTPQTLGIKILFWGKYSEITGGHMLNKVTSATDYLTVSGSTGSETYQCPNNQNYKDADTDYIWFKSDATQRTTTTAELVGYDFPRTLVKYDNTTPYALREIIILKAGQTLTTDEENRLRDYMQLSIWWSNVLSFHGSRKENRGTGQSVWNREPVYCDEYNAVFNAFATKPSDADAVIQNTMLKALIDGGYFAKAEFLDIFATHGNAEGLFDWKNPTGTHNPTAVGSPTWTQYKGFTGASGKRINLNYNPTTHGGGRIGQDNICVIGANFVPGVVGPIMGGIPSNYVGQINLNAEMYSTRPVFELNSNVGYAVNFWVDGNVHFGLSRNNGTTVHYVWNNTSGSYEVASNGLNNTNLSACGATDGGGFDSATTQVPYVFLFSYLTETEMKTITAIMNAYLANYGMGLY